VSVLVSVSSCDLLVEVNVGAEAPSAGPECRELVPFVGLVLPTGVDGGAAAVPAGVDADVDVDVDADADTARIAKEPGSLSSELERERPPGSAGVTSSRSPRLLGVGLLSCLLDVSASLPPSLMNK